MPSLIDMRRRIRTVRNTQQITKAMKMISAARLRRAQERVFNARPYASLLKEVIGSMAARIEANAAPDAPPSGRGGANGVSNAPPHPLLAARPLERVLAVVVSGDRGLCGAFNTNILRATERFLEQHRDKEVKLVLVGRKGRDYFRRRRVTIEREYVGIFTRLDFSHAQEIAMGVIASYEEAKTDGVFLIFNEFRSVLSQRVVAEQLLPLQGLQATSAQAAAFLKVDYIYEQAPREIHAALLPRYVESLLFRALLESAAAEHAARMTAMDAATNNAGEMIDNLTLTMNRIRQASITKEIIEVVSGAAAL